MYKRITHNITEHHYAHPAAPVIQHAMMSANIPSTMAQETIVDFMSAVHDGFNQYLWNMRHYMLSILNGTDDTDFLNDEINTTIDALASVVKTYYNTSAGQIVADYLHGCVTALADETNALKDGNSVTDIQAAHDAAIEKFVSIIHSLNPDAWPKDTVGTIFTQLDDSWVEQITARLEKKWTDDMDAMKSAIKLIISGQDDGTPGFAHIFAAGIAHQFPQDFT